MTVQKLTDKHLNLATMRKFPQHIVWIACCAVIVLLVAFRRQINSFINEETPQSVIVQTSIKGVVPFVPFTAEEQRYVKYGEASPGVVVHQRDERYLQMLRSQIARPTFIRKGKSEEINPVSCSICIKVRTPCCQNSKFSF